MIKNTLEDKYNYLKNSSVGKMAGQCDLQEKISELSNLLQSEKDLRATEQTEKESIRKQMDDLQKEVQQLKLQLQKEKSREAAQGL